MGLELAWQQGYRRVELEVDSAPIHSLLTLTLGPTAGLNGLVYDCRRILQRPWHVDVKFIYREANGVVDGVAKWVLDQTLGYHHLQFPLASIYSFLLADLIGEESVRLVPHNGLLM